jgi:hypothetical protein
VVQHRLCLHFDEFEAAQFGRVEGGAAEFEQLGLLDR